MKLIFIILSLLDFLLTKILISDASGEINPFASLAIKHYGFFGLFLYKIFWVAIIILCLSKVPKSISRRILLFANTALLLVCLYSFSIYLLLS